MTGTPSSAHVSKQPRAPSNTVDFKKLLFCFLVGALIHACPMPAEMDPKGWTLFAIFVATILGIVIKPLPMGAVTLLSMTVAIVTRTIGFEEALEGFSSHVVWLVVLAFFIAKGFVVTGFGNRMGYFFTGLWGKKTLGLGYALAITDLIMSPAVPSVTARSAGIVYPIVQSIAHTYDSFPNDASARKIGAYLTLTAFQVTVITSAMFLTAMAANPLLQDLVENQGVELTWSQWALAGSVPGILSLMIVPWLIFKLSPPEIKITPNASHFAKKKLKEMGPMTRAEWIMASTLVILLVLWIFGKNLHISAVTAGMIGLCILLITGVLDWNVLLKENNAWETYFWFCILIMLAQFLNTYGVTTWFSEESRIWFGDWPWMIGFPVLALIYFFTHYFFASSVAHVSAMFVPFLLIAWGFGTPPLLAVWILIFFSNLFGGITHYSLAPAPLLFGAGYVDLKTWWKVGFFVALVNIVIWSVFGSLWWKFLGMW